MLRPGSKRGMVLGAAWLLVAAQATAAPRARNVILFLGDAGGIPTINAAAIFANRPTQLFIQRMPHLALVETSSATEWVTDSAAGMTAIVTGQKTVNGVLSQDATAVPGVKDGVPLETILEQAERRGLSTGIISNDSFLGATPAACYAHVNTRKNLAEILTQLFMPRVGNGVDVVIGSGRKAALDAARERGLNVNVTALAAGYSQASDLAAIPPAATRLLVMLEDRELDLARAVGVATRILARNPKGYFLMVESDVHTNGVEKGLKRTLALDALIQRTAERADKQDTLVLFTADHSFDLRVQAGKKGAPLVGTPAFRMDDSHTGEEVLAAAQGPGAEGVHGYIANTELFHIMRRAFGWGAEPAVGPAASPTVKPVLRGRPCVWPKTCDDEVKEPEQAKEKPQQEPTPKPTPKQKQKQKQKEEKWPPQPAVPGR
jgi:alkaline phosphatase